MIGQHSLYTRRVLATFVAIVGILPIVVSVLSADVPSGLKMKTESFDRDPGWVGRNNRSAQTNKPRMVCQDFGFSPNTNHAKGNSPGEMGGFLSPAGEVAFYGRSIPPKTLNDPLTASGKITMGQGGTHLLLGFFNSDTVHEWRTPNSMAMRLNGRGDNYFAYVEYCTQKWRAGGDTTPFPSVIDPKTGRWNLIGFPCEQSSTWSLNYDPNGNGGKGVIAAKIGDAMAICNLDENHKQDGMTFNRFGIMTVMKSADSGSEVWFDDIQVNGDPVESFLIDPQWDARNNRRTYASRLVRPWFDFGFSDSNYAGGKGTGELGGQIFRGDCRYPERLAAYGDQIGPLTLAKPFKASGKIAMTRGVTDSTALFGFYNSVDSLKNSDSQNDSTPESLVGIQVEGPSSDGFHFYPVVRAKNKGGRPGNVRLSPIIYPDGRSHTWSLEYNVDPETRKGLVKVALDGQSTTMELSSDEATDLTKLDRFGIVTTWIDGNSQDVFWDDITYTVSQE